MATISEDDFKSLLQDIGSGELVEEIGLILLDSGLRSAQVTLLGRLDKMVDTGDINDRDAAEFYRRLGFSKEEMSQIRQRVESKTPEGHKQKH